MAAITGPERVLGGLCFVCINRISPGLVKHSGGARVDIGEWSTGIPGRAIEIAARFKAAGVPATAVDNIEQALKEKGPVTIPREFVFMDRAAIGLGAAFLHLGAEHNWRKLFEDSLEGFDEEALAARQAGVLKAAGLA